MTVRCTDLYDKSAAANFAHCPFDGWIDFSRTAPRFAVCHFGVQASCTDDASRTFLQFGSRRECLTVPALVDAMAQTASQVRFLRDPSPHPVAPQHVAFIGDRYGECSMLVRSQDAPRPMVFHAVEAHASYVELHRASLALTQDGARGSRAPVSFYWTTNDTDTSTQMRHVLNAVSASTDHRADTTASNVLIFRCRSCFDQYYLPRVHWSRVAERFGAVAFKWGAAQIAASNQTSEKAVARIAAAADMLRSHGYRVMYVGLREWHPVKSLRIDSTVDAVWSFAAHGVATSSPGGRCCHNATLLGSNWTTHTDSVEWAAAVRSSISSDGPAAFNRNGAYFIALRTDVAVQLLNHWTRVADDLAVDDDETCSALPEVARWPGADAKSIDRGMLDGDEAKSAARRAPSTVCSDRYPPVRVPPRPLSCPVALPDIVQDVSATLPRFFLWRYAAQSDLVSGYFAAHGHWMHCTERLPQLLAAGRGLVDEWAHRLRLPPDVATQRFDMIEIGSNIGTCALYAASQGYRVLAVEPHPDHCALISRSIVDNNFSARILLARMAVGRQQSNKTVHLFSRRGNLGDTVAIDGGDGPPPDERGAFAVTQRSLAEVLAARHVVAAGVLKLDCQGCEISALLSAGAALSRDAYANNFFPIIVFELSPHRLRRVETSQGDPVGAARRPQLLLWHLWDLGYSVFDAAGLAALHDELLWQVARMPLHRDVGRNRRGAGIPGRDGADGVDMLMDAAVRRHTLIRPEGDAAALDRWFASQHFAGFTNATNPTEDADLVAIRRDALLLPSAIRAFLSPTRVTTSQAEEAVSWWRLRSRDRTRLAGETSTPKGKHVAAAVPVAFSRVRYLFQTPRNCSKS